MPCLAKACGAHPSLVEEPGLDLQYWETRWAELEEQFADDAAGTLVEAADFVESMLGDYGYEVDRVLELGEPAAAGEATDVVADYRAARQVADKVDMDVNVDDADVVAAMTDLREIYRTLSVLEHEGVAGGPDDVPE
jgi:hypothetical protein